jgi:hypothetical protein
MMYPTERNSPTLWPIGPGEKTSMEIALEARQEENRSLKTLVVHLSEIILQDIAGKK